MNPKIGSYIKWMEDLVMIIFPPIAFDSESDDGIEVCNYQTYKVFISRDRSQCKYIISVITLW